MKTSNTFLKIFLGCLFMLAFCANGNAQFLKKLGKKAQKAAERTVERRVERETEKKTDKALDSILEPGAKGERGEQKPNPPTTNESGTRRSQNGESSPTASSKEQAPLKIYSKFDFVPGDKLMFFDDFANDFIGDFPSKWNTNGSGEVVTINDSSEKWFELVTGYGIYYIPDVPDLPEEYTIEFDILTHGLDRQTSSVAVLNISLSNHKTFKQGNSFFNTSIPFCQYAPIGIRVKNSINGASDINNSVNADIRKTVLNQPHISIAVNKQRFRLWVNEKKYVDIPRAIASGGILSTLKFHANGLKDGKERIFINNLKVAEGGVDLRRKLIEEGSISTNGILFDSGSANIQPQSYGIIRQISQVLLQETSMRLKIVGHTDSDGGTDTNQSLSKKRADAVKKALTDVYNISGDRLETDGKGESVPVSDNGTADGKAQNRRVEFIKI